MFLYLLVDNSQGRLDFWPVIEVRAFETYVWKVSYWIGLSYLCNLVTIQPSPPHPLHPLSRTFSLLYGRWSTSGPRGVTHISCHYKNTIEGREKIEGQMNKHEQCLGLTQSRRRVCNTTCICGLTLAWVTSENSTKQLECRHLLTRSSSLDPIFSAGLTAPVSSVNCHCLWFHANCLPAPLSHQLSFASPYHFRIPRDFRYKNPLSRFAPKQTTESSAWQATYIVLQSVVKTWN